MDSQLTEFGFPALVGTFLQSVQTILASFTLGNGVSYFRGKVTGA
jgi:hypothetical protein